MLRGKRVFVSGGNGVIGNTLVARLNAAGALILVGDLKSRPRDWPASIHYRQGDLNFITRQELEEFRPEYFFHLAATFERSTETYEFWNENSWHNVRLSTYLMTLLKDIPSLKKVVFASSYLIYDKKLYNFTDPATTATCLKETDPILPRNLTGAAKLNHEIELSFLNGFKSNQFQTVSARIYRSYGRYSRDIISRWIRALLKGEEIVVYKKEGLFDYVFGEDVADGLMKLAITDGAHGIVNLGRGRARRVADILNVLKKYFPEMKYREEDSDILYEASEADMMLFEKMTGWKPALDIEVTIPRMIEYERNNRFQDAQQSMGNVLVTSISKKVPFIKAVKAACRKMGPDIKLYGADVNENCIGKKFVDEFWRMPVMNELTIKDVIDYCKTQNIEAIIPSRDGELVFWAAHRKRLCEEGISVMVSALDSINLCLDKLTFYKQMSRMGFPVIHTSEKIEDVKDSLLVVKERYGAGSISIGLKLQRQDAIIHAQNLREPIFQPFIEAREVSVDAYIDSKGNIKGIVLRDRNLVVAGESQVTTTFQNSKLEAMCVDFLKKLSLYGHVVLQVLIDGAGSFHIIECNSRFGGASTLGIAAGLDSFYWFLLECNGADLEDYRFLRSQNRKTQIRYPEDIIIDDFSF